jgi:hypothetical protein|tara:strand:+ start:2969 stop:3541 length:573 start_codon:yes stop_codon:yes gene_type:complete
MEQDFEFNNTSELADLIENFQGSEFDAQEGDDLISLLEEVDLKMVSDRPKTQPEVNYKKISIIPENSYLIDEWLADFQAGCRVNMLNYSNLEEASKIAESILDELLKKQSRQNVCAVVKPKYEKFKPEYPYEPAHTECYIRRGRKNWYITSMVRANANRGGSSKVEILRDSLGNKNDEIINFVTKNLKRS